MWYKNLLRTDNGLKPQIVRVTEEIDKGIKHRRDIANPSHGMPLFRLGGLYPFFVPTGFIYLGYEEPPCCLGGQVFPYPRTIEGLGHDSHFRLN